MSDDLDSLEDLYEQAMLSQAAKNPRQRRVADPASKLALEADAKTLRELYTNPDNWERRRGVALIDEGTHTLIGNFSEYVHLRSKGTRKLVREHQPISIDATEIVSGYLGESVEQRLRGREYTVRHHVDADVWFEEMMVGAPKVALVACCHLGAMIRLEVHQDTQFASASGATLLRLPAGTDILSQVSPDTKRHVWRAVQPR